jgi:antitoxin (DNA-binding transcriptional repressor) of toxin-antitoxin stability system
MKRASITQAKNGLSALIEGGEAVLIVDRGRPVALQLAAAFIAAERRPSSLRVVTLDDRLADAARKEGFELIDVSAA